AEALRLRKKVAKQEIEEARGLAQDLKYGGDPKEHYTVREIEEARGLAQVLLGRWPGLAPGIARAERPRASFAIDAPSREPSPVADGRIAPGEYGSGLDIRFEGDTNPGRMYLWFKSRSKTPDDLSVRIHAVHTARSLFLAFAVRDQFVDASELDA